MAIRNWTRLAVLAGSFIAFCGVASIGLLAEENKPEETKPAENKPAQKDPAELFAELDKNGDGKLKGDEIAAGQKRFFEHLLRVAGKEKDGELTREEFLKGFKPDDLKVTPPPNFGGAGGPGGQFNPGQLFQRFDSNKDGKLALDEIPEQGRERFRPIFDQLDKKELTREEFVKAMEQRRGGGGDFMRDAEGSFKRFDANQDGKLTFDEAPEQIRPMIERWLKRLGKEKDGILTLDDVKKIVAENQARAGNGPGRPGVQNELRPLFLRKMDTNGDGKLSKEELQKATDLFSEFDRNKDGFLDPQELLGPPPVVGQPPAGQRPGVEGPATGKSDRPETPAAEGAPATRAGDANRGAEAGSQTSPRDSDASRDKPVASAPNRNGQRFMALAAKGLQPGRRGPGQREPGQRLDGNGDGKISRDEARGRLKDKFDTIDKNGDGFLDRDEIRSALQQVRGK